MWQTSWCDKPSNGTTLIRDKSSNATNLTSDKRHNATNQVSGQTPYCDNLICYKPPNATSLISDLVAVPQTLMPVIVAKSWPVLVDAGLDQVGQDSHRKDGRLPTTEYLSQPGGNKNQVVWGLQLKRAAPDSECWPNLDQDPGLTC